MAIQELSIHGYRSLREVTWCPGQLNLLVGPNASGKSNLLRALELISIAARGNLQQTISSGGGIIPLLWDHRPGAVSWNVRIDPVNAERRDVEEAINYEMKIHQQGTGSGYEVMADHLRLTHKAESELGIEPYWIFAREQGNAFFWDVNESQRVQLEESRPATSNLSFPLGPQAHSQSVEVEGFDPNESLLPQIADFRNWTPLLSKRKLDAWRIYHDVHVDRESAMRQPATTQVATRLDPDAGNLATVLHTHYTNSREFRDQIDQGMRAGFGGEYEGLKFPPAAAQQIQLAVQWRSSSQPHAGSDLSDGTLRFLFLLAVLCNPDSTEVVAIDEPEVGLHPSMLPIIAEYAAAASERMQIILTSHSPEFLDAFTELSPSVTICHWEDGETSLHPLDSDELAVWLKRYRLGELFSRGDLDTLALSPVETSDDLDSRLDGLPSQDEALA